MKENQDMENTDMEQETKNKIKNPKIEKLKSLVTWFLIGVVFVEILFIASFKLPLSVFGLDSYLYKGPGEPEEVQRYIEIEGYENEDNYHITYVQSLEYRTFGHMLFVFIHNIKNSDFPMTPYQKIDDKYDQRKQEQEETETVIGTFQDRSIQIAIYVAYKELGKLNELNINFAGVLITGLVDKNIPGLEIGDYVYSLEGVKIKDSKHLVSELQKYKDEENVEMIVIREDKKTTINHPISVENGIVKLGVFIEDIADIEIPEEIKIDFDNLEGPSAGLMLTMFIYDTLLEEDVAKGYKIAGTGTIEPDGSIGQIGGIEFKLEGAMKTNVDIFFLPKDKNSYDDNEKIATEFMEDKDTDMKIVPVSNVREVLDYLNNLEPNPLH